MKAMTMQILNNNHEARSKKQGARTAGVLASCFLLLASVTHAQDAQTLVSQMQGAERSVSYSAIRKSGGDTIRVFRSGLKQRLQWLSPDVRHGDVQVDDGEHVTLYHRAEKSATQTDSRLRAPAFAPTGTPAKTTFAGRRAFSVRVGGNRTLVIDAQTKALLAVRGGNRNGGFALSDIRFAPVPASQFVFVAPAGVNVQKIAGALYNNVNRAKRAARWLQTPLKPPAGFSFESAIVGSNSAWLRYSNGQNRISLFEQPTTAVDLGPQPVEGGGTFWRKNGVRFLATGSPGSALGQVVDALK